MYVSEGSETSVEGSEDEKLYIYADPNNIKVQANYSGPHLQFPMTVAQLQQLIASFKKKQVGGTDAAFVVGRRLMNYDVSLCELFITSFSACRTVGR